jgi:hypothetical protein
VTIQRDTQAPNAPSLSLSGFSSGTWNPTTLNVQNNGDNGPSGVAAFQCSVNNGSWGSCPSNVASLGHGTTIVARAVDYAGNVERKQQHGDDSAGHADAERAER